jgi:MoaA/NifB/PqqE/SkfB family radical SAM enzyme
MTLAEFEKLVPAFKRSQMVHLQGWGEPFLNPHFLDMLDLVKKSGCLAGTTTNGMLVDERLAKALVLGGLDMLAFSLAGVGTENDNIRPGTTMDGVLAAIKEVSRIKHAHGREKPDIHVAYMLFRSGFKNLEKLPAVLAGS